MAGISLQLQGLHTFSEGKSPLVPAQSSQPRPSLVYSSTRTSNDGSQQQSGSASSRRRPAWLQSQQAEHIGNGGVRAGVSHCDRRPAPSRFEAAVAAIFRELDIRRHARDSPDISGPIRTRRRLWRVSAQDRSRWLRDLPARTADSRILGEHRRGQGGLEREAGLLREQKILRSLHGCSPCGRHRARGRHWCRRWSQQGK
ncbi:hypothetical protein GGR56DRAFT_659377 [Xylariaceae sp. FL0804]|nr:hypothetical protein GGR56DRAFT_659377 [Xylariaceae sp. FL0804]